MSRSKKIKPAPGPGTLGAAIREETSRRDLDHAERTVNAERARIDRDLRRLTEPAPVDRRGGFGRAAGRVGHLMRLPPLVATSAVLCSAAYQAVEEPPLPADGAYIGVDVFSRAAFTFDIHELYRRKLVTSPNMAIVGEIGTGKSALLKTIAYRSTVFGTRYSCVDVKGEYESLAAATDVTPVRVGPGLGTVLNPLAGIHRVAGLAADQWLHLQRSRRLLLLEGVLEIQIGEKLTEAERSLLEYALDAATRTGDGTSVERMETPTLSGVLAAMGDTAAWAHRLAALDYPLADFVVESRRVRLALERLISGVLGHVFDAPAGTAGTIGLDFQAAGTVLDLRAIRSSDAMTAMAVTCAQSWMEAVLSDPGAGSRLCIYDEFALLARYLHLIRRLREQWKLARLLGIGNLAAFHRWSDMLAAGAAGSEEVRIARGLIEDTGIRVAYRQAVGSVADTAEYIGGSDTELRLLPRLRQGTGLWRIGTRSYVVKHQLSTDEIAMVHTDSQMEARPELELTDADYDERLETAATGLARRTQ
ncbi:hypothetical protein AB0M43_23725 [Longispora sp. NPDC051575]|uniref:hypothetical protein n=1 Tax=Longispora sp. NPDC051575 TaxID=3154943 RepID=UPI00342D987F